MRFLTGLAMLAAAVFGVAALALMPWWALLALALAFVAWMVFSRRGSQAWSVTWVGLSTLPQRLGSSSVVVVGIAGVVGVLVALLAMGEGFQATLKQTGSDDTAIVMRAGAQAELNSVLDHDSATLIAQAPGVLKDKDGRPIASPELVVVASLPKKSSGLDANVEIRGVGPGAWALRPQVKIVAGRAFNRGLREMIAGKGAREQFAGLDIGSTLRLNNQTWTVVGAFDSGDAHDSELWADADVVAATYRRGSSVTSVTARLTGAGAFDAFKAALASDPRLKVDAQTTRAYYTAQSAGLAKLIRILGTTVGAIMAIGAIFGALNTMYAAVSARAREIATLRAIGFRGLPVVVSVLLETMLLALAGGVLGAAIAWLIFDNYTVSTLGANFSQVVFGFKVSPALLWNGLKWALAMGFVGGLFPALRAARLPVSAALREL
ncbi:MAG: ABC transporter permease [Mizugakiibacter sp.]|uniref:ABC transporter permease n=1 Tax=Mizugakiibacter sp. TaxID=1972610 RepID=UPI0031C35418|nr:ABC transporter permease [Xanthomonadaceae bacterium]